MRITQATKAIRNAWIAALVSAGVTLIVPLISSYKTPILEMGFYILLDVGLILLLAYGIYRKSRIAALAMLIYHMANQVIMYIEHGLRGLGPIVGFFFFIIYLQGVIGSFAYHRLVQDK